MKGFFMKRKLFMFSAATAAVLLLSGCSLFDCGKPATPVKPAATTAPTAPAKAKKAKFKAPVLENAQSWTMVVVPDVQGYTKLRRNYGILEIMHAWIV